MTVRLRPRRGPAGRLLRRREALRTTSEYELTEKEKAQKKVHAAVKNGVGHDVWTAVRVYCCVGSELFA